MKSADLSPNRRSIQIVPLESNDLPAAAELFTHNYRRLRQAVPALPLGFAQPAGLIERLQSMVAAGRLLAAVQAGRLLGYLSWYLVDGFRAAARRAAYCPVWGHAVVEGQEAAVYSALYAEAARLWLQAGRNTHALTFLAGDRAQQNLWFWNGFGLAVVDAVRDMQPLGVECPSELVVRIAEAADAEALAALDREHCQHYTQPPVLMAARLIEDAAALASFIAQPGCSIWLAEWAGQPAGFLRFAAGELDMADIVQGQDTVGITGAYTRPEFRGCGIAPALLDAALSHYSALGFGRCAVDFESFNPQAAGFWPRYFTPVCYSVIRVPEAP